MKCGINIFDDLNTEKVNYVVWKNSNIIDNFFNGEENLDIYIHKDDHERFQFLSKKNNWIEVKSTSNNFKEIKHYLFFAPNKILHIHAYFKLFTGNSISKNYDLSTFVNYFQNKHFDNRYRIWILNYDIQLLLFKIRIAIKRRSLLGRFLLLREKNNYKKEISYIKNNIQTKNTNPKLDLININFLTTNLADKKYVNNDYLLNSVKSFKRVNLFQTFIHELLFLGNIFIQKLFKLKKFKFNKNQIIFISGPDSSGKTTITNDLKNLFKRHFKTKVFSIGKPYPVFFIKTLIKKNYFQNKKISINHLTNKNIDPSYLRLLKNINLAIFRYIYSLNIFYFNQSTSIIILDRYLSENVGDVNGPRTIITNKGSSIKKIFSTIEIYFYKKTKFINHEYQIITDLENCLERNRKRYKAVKKNDDEIIKRFKKYNKSNFKSKEKFMIDNNAEKKGTIKYLLNLLSRSINENN
tara:strand:- start:777 stop:2174 length:1398 start_codon:yes stop_codon:yes gene_type:complete